MPKYWYFSFWNIALNVPGGIVTSVHPVIAVTRLTGLGRKVLISFHEIPEEVYIEALAPRKGGVEVGNGD